LANQLHITQQSQLAPELVEQFRTIYLDSFPPHERGDFALLLESIRADKCRLFTATAGDDLVGFAILMPNITRGVHYLVYLAVSRNARSGGIGGILLERAVELLRAAGNTTGILFEVETDDEGTADERQLRKRRIAFYQRHNARLIESVTHFRAPSAISGELLNLKLMWLPMNPTTETPAGARLREYIVALYARGYGLPEDDPLVQSVLRENSIG
jgi:ribosomal protein S18 acetylase RimI-like enzyme